MEDELREIEEKERSSSVKKSDRDKFYVFLSQPIELDLITPEDAQNLMEQVKTGKMAISEAYNLVGEILSEKKRPLNLEMATYTF